MLLQKSVVSEQMIKLPSVGILWEIRWHKVIFYRQKYKSINKEQVFKKCNQIQCQRCLIWCCPPYFHSDSELGTQGFLNIARCHSKCPLCSLYQTNLWPSIQLVSSLHSSPIRPQEGYLFWEEGGKLSIITRRNNIVTRGHINIFSHLMWKTLQK